MRNWFCLLLLTVVSYGYAQNIEIKRVNQPIVIDGKIDDVWSTADSAYNFQQFFPMDTSLAYAQSMAKVLYDDQFIYVIGIMQNPDGDRGYITPSLRRDFFGDANDSFSILIDAFQDNTNAFIFGINPFGVRREGLIANGGSGQGAFSLDWDNKWRGEARQENGYWVAEMAIPPNPFALKMVKLSLKRHAIEKAVLSRY